MKSSISHRLGRRNGCLEAAFIERRGGQGKSVMTADEPITRAPAESGPSGWRDEVVGLIPALRAFAWSLCHNGADADDLVQEALIKAWANRERFEAGTN